MSTEVELCCVCLERLPNAPVVALLNADRAPRSGAAACDHLLHEACASQLARPFRCPICRAPFAALARVPPASELLAHHGATLATTARMWSGDVARTARRCALATVPVTARVLDEAVEPPSTSFEPATALSEAARVVVALHRLGVVDTTTTAESAGATAQAPARARCARLARGGRWLCVRASGVAGGALGGVAGGGALGGAVGLALGAPLSNEGERRLRGLAEWLLDAESAHPPSTLFACLGVVVYTYWGARALVWAAARSLIGTREPPPPQGARAAISRARLARNIRLGGVIAGACGGLYGGSVGGWAAARAHEPSEDMALTSPHEDATHGGSALRRACAHAFLSGCQRGLSSGLWWWRAMRADPHDNRPSGRAVPPPVHDIAALCRRHRRERAAGVGGE